MEDRAGAILVHSRKEVTWQLRAPQEDAVLEVRDLRFGWTGAADDCVRLAQLDLAAGERLFISGPSGCGKSTLLSLLAGVLLPRSGTVRLQGREWASMSAAARDRVRADNVGYIFQQFNLVPYLSVLDNTLLPCRFSRQRAKRAGDPRVEAGRLLERAGLGRESVESKRGYIVGGPATAGRGGSRAARRSGTRDGG